MNWQSFAAVRQNSQSLPILPELRFTMRLVIQKVLLAKILDVMTTGY